MKLILKVTRSQSGQVLVDVPDDITREQWPILAQNFGAAWSALPYKEQVIWEPPVVEISEISQASADQL